MIPPNVWVSSTPINLDMIGDSSTDVRAMSVLVSLKVLPIEASEGVRVFQATGELKATLDLTGYDNPPTAGPTPPAACLVAEHLVHGSSSSAPPGANELMDWLNHHDSLEVDAGRRCLKYTCCHNVCHG